MASLERGLLRAIPSRVIITFKWWHQSYLHPYLPRPGVTWRQLMWSLNCYPSNWCWCCCCRSCPVWAEKNRPKMISLEKWLILTSLQKLPKNVGDLDKLIVAKVAQSPINRPIWSHCSCLPTFIPSYLFPSQCCKTWEFHSNVKKDFWLLLASAAED